MISTKLNSNAITKNLLIEFSENSLHPVLEKFYLNCKDEGVLTRRSSALDPSQLNFHLVELEEKLQISCVTLNNVAHNFTFIISIFYIYCEEQEQQRQKVPPIQRSLLLREGLDVRFFLHYEYENTQSEQESLIYLCEISATIINSQHDRDISFYDQSSMGIKGVEKDSEKLWLNILFQIPGLGQEKCRAIAGKYPNYERLLKDYEGERGLPNLLVRSGLKEMRLGTSLATRIYKALFSLNCTENIMAPKKQ